MIPGPGHPGISGINTVINSYGEMASDYGINFVSSGGDVSIIHGGMGGRKHMAKQCDIAMLHGIYFTAEYPAKRWEKWANRLVIDNILSAKVVTVPSDWVAKTLRKEFKIDPYILEHGVFWDYWQHDIPVKPNQIFWGKNRIFEDVCDPVDLLKIAEVMPDIDFITTLAPTRRPANVHQMGLLKPHEIKPIIQESAVVLSTIKETWGLLYMEALAAGTPVVASNVGHVPNLVRHGVGGYCYRHGDLEDLRRGILWTIENREVLSRNAKIIAKNYSWDKTMLKLRRILEYVMEIK
jgi:hypothetical protein